MSHCLASFAAVAQALSLCVHVPASSVTDSLSLSVWLSSSLSGTEWCR